MKTWKYLLLLFCIVWLVGCKKDVDPPDPEPVSTEAELIRDSIYYYYNLQSLWTTSIPDYDVLRTFTANYSSDQGVLDALKALTPYYAGYGGSIDRFSFIQDNGSGEQLSSSTGLRMDTADGYGVYFGWGRLTSTATVAYPVIYFVEGGSPAQLAGITRGSILLSLNDDTNVTVPITCSGSSCTLNQTAYNSFVTKLDAALEATSLSLKVSDVNGVEKVHPLTYKTYEIDPILADTVYRYPEKNIGYFAFSSFEEVTGNNQNYQNFQRIFQSFETAGIKELIMDMRYNTGGYVNTAEYLANKIAPAAAEGGVMFTYEVNAALQPYTVRASRGYDFTPVNFARNNNLALEKVYVLVTESTASAAELLINVLKPYMTVVLIAETDRTYGKPVGFFEQEIMSKISLWATSFKTKNKNGATDYWDGMAVDQANVTDRIFSDFGDPTEDMIAAALRLSGVTTANTGNRASVSRSGASSAARLKLGVINKPAEKNMLKQQD